MAVRRCSVRSTLPNRPTTRRWPAARSNDSEVGGLLRQLLAGQDRQNELLEELIGQISSNQRQRAHELGQWKQANPRLARNCRAAAEALGKVQTEFLDSLTREIGDNYENLMEGEFMLNEFVDRFGPRMAHLNGLLQVLSQLTPRPIRPARRMRNKALPGAELRAPTLRGAGVSPAGNAAETAAPQRVLSAPLSLAVWT